MSVIGTAGAIVGAVAPALGTLIDRLIPDKHAAAKAKLEIETALVDAANEVSKGQIEVNKAEAQHHSIFVAGWRPFIGWVCGLSIAWAFIIHDLLVWVLAVCGVPAGLFPPAMDTSIVFELTLAMLGMGGLRTFEKLRGVARR